MCVFVSKEGINGGEDGTTRRAMQLLTGRKYTLLYFLPIVFESVDIVSLYTLLQTTVEDVFWPVLFMPSLFLS